VLFLGPPLDAAAGEQAHQIPFGPADAIPFVRR
jgi:hypothetical protein